jgi:hypothetical protein
MSRVTSSSSSLLFGFFTNNCAFVFLSQYIESKGDVYTANDCDGDDDDQCDCSDETPTPPDVTPTPPFVEPPFQLW